MATDGMLKETKAADVAAFIVEDSTNTGMMVSNLLLNKILFLIQRDYMVENYGNPVFSDDFEAWQFGPVVPQVYFLYSKFGGSRITEPVMFRRLNFFTEQKETTEPLKAKDAFFVKEKLSDISKRKFYEIAREVCENDLSWSSVYNKDGIEGSGYRHVISKETIYENGKVVR